METRDSGLPRLDLLRRRHVGERVLDALEKGPHAQNTIVVLWSDHGWHLGEKEHWQKFTAWRVCSRVPLIMRVRKELRVCPKLPNRLDAQAGQLAQPRTHLLELSGLPRPNCTTVEPCSLAGGSEGRMASRFLDPPSSPRSFGLSDAGWRYIRYADGGEELYEIEKDPYEWNNLAGDKKYLNHLKRLRKKAPVKFAKLVEPKIDSLPGAPMDTSCQRKKKLLRPSLMEELSEVTFLNRSKQK